MNKSSFKLRFLILLDMIQRDSKLGGLAMKAFADSIIASHEIIREQCSLTIGNYSLEQVKLLQLLSHKPAAVRDNVLYFTSSEYASFKRYASTVFKVLNYTSKAIKC